VTNFAYTRWNIIYPEVIEKIHSFEKEFVKVTPEIDAKALALYKTDPKQAVSYLTEYSTRLGDKVTDDWKHFYRYLFMRFMDGNIKAPVPGEMNPHVEYPGYPVEFLRRIVEETGDQFKVIGADH